MREAQIRRARNRSYPLFSAWLDDRVDSMLLANEVVSPELRNLSQLPKSIVAEYRTMWAFGNHFRVEDPLMGNQYLTYDSGVACVAATVCQASAADRRPAEATLQYVGILDNIIQLDYIVRQINVLACSWIKPNVMGNPSMRQDSHKFTLIKHVAFQPANAEPYVMPAHVSQVRAFIRCIALTRCCYPGPCNCRDYML